MNNFRFDLNLLLVFQMIMREGNLTRAGEKLLLSQPAVSAALGRLRSLVGDPLFVRQGQRMMPTPRAQQLIEPIETALSTIRHALQTDPEFEPSSSNRTFQLLMSDLDATTLLPRMIGQIRSLNSGVCLSASQIECRGVKDILNAFEMSKLDLVIGYWPELSPERGFRQARLFSEKLVCVAGLRHSGRPHTFRLQDYVDAQHVVVTLPFASAHAVDKWLAAQGLHRKTIARVPHYLSVPAIIAATDCIATVPAGFAATLAIQSNLQILPLPIPLPANDISVYWHSRSKGDAGLEWLVDLLVREFERPAAIRPSEIDQAGHLESRLAPPPLTPSSDPNRPRFSSTAELLV